MSVFLFALFSKRSFVGSAQLILYHYRIFLLTSTCLSVFLFALFSKRSFTGSAKLILYHYRIFLLTSACLSVFLFALFSKRSFIGSAQLFFQASLKASQEYEAYIPRCLLASRSMKIDRESKLD